MEMKTTDANFSNDSSEEMHRPLTFSEGPSGSCVTLRPRLQWMKSFPPQRRCIGGLGHSDTESHSEAGVFSHQRPGSDEMMKDTNEVFRGSEREEAPSKQRCTREGVRTKWRERRMQRFGGSYEGKTSDRWTEKEWVGGEKVVGLEEAKEGGARSEWTESAGEDTGAERMKVLRDEKTGGRTILAKDGEHKTREETCEHKDEGEALGALRPRGHSTTHLTLSKLLHSSSSSSSCSSINFSSVESDDVFSEGEDVNKNRKTLRKCRSWKTYLSLVHWSLGRQSSWVQVAGHQGNFQLSGGEVLKRYNDEEAKCLDCLMSDSLRPFVPQYHGTVTRGEHCYMRLEDLLQGLKRPVIMDCKMGVRTFQEEEVVKAQTKATLRSDMYHKMLKIDPSALSAEEHAQRGVTKWRYLQWRDSTTTTSTLGLRIEAIMIEDNSIQRDFRNIRTLAEVSEVLLYFTRSQLDILKAYHSRLLAISDALMNSHFFRTHEVIGSSLLFVHDCSLKASVWMIDFGKTTPVHDTIKLQHNTPWLEGNREDGYLIGLSSLISSLSQAISVVSRQQEDCGTQERRDHMNDTQGCD